MSVEYNNHKIVPKALTSNYADMSYKPNGPFKLPSKEEVYELARRGPYYRFIEFPVNIKEEMDKWVIDETRKQLSSDGFRV